MVAQSPLATKNWAGPVKFDPWQVKIILDYIRREIFWVTKRKSSFETLPRSGKSSKVFSDCREASTFLLLWVVVERPCGLWNAPCILLLEDVTQILNVKFLKYNFQTHFDHWYLAQYLWWNIPLVTAVRSHSAQLMFGFSTTWYQCLPRCMALYGVTGPVCNIILLSHCNDWGILSE